MKRLLIGSVVALALTVTAAPAWADCYFESCCSRHVTFVRTAKSRCWSCTTYCNPLPCISSSCGNSVSSPALWGGLAAYGPAPYAVAPAPVAGVPLAAPAGAPAFRAPQPTPAVRSTNGVQQAGYSYYGQTNNAGYGYNAGYNYGAGYGYGYYGYGAGYGYAQAPNYWY